MPSKRWFVQIYRVGGKPETPLVFTNVEEVCAFVDEFRRAGSSGAVTVYSMELTTTEEEKAFDESITDVSVLH